MLREYIQEMVTPYVPWYAPGHVVDCPFPSLLLQKKHVLMYPMADPLLGQSCAIFKGNPHASGVTSRVDRNCRHTIICRQFFVYKCPLLGPPEGKRLPWKNYVYALIWDPEEPNDHEYVNVWSSLAIDACFGTLHFAIVWTPRQQWCLCHDCKEEWFDRDWICPMAASRHRYTPSEGKYE